MKGRELKVVSLFSGCGGMDLGFEGGFAVKRRCVNGRIHPDWVEAQEGEWATLRRTGFRTVFANDIRPDAKAAWENHWARRGSGAAGTYRISSIVDLVKAAREGRSVFPEGVDVVTGGFPCQDFSVAGKRQGFNSVTSHLGRGAGRLSEPSVESRGCLYMWMRDVVDLLRPNVFVAENVKGLVSLADAKSIIERDFRDIGGGGYLVADARVLCAADYGVPQSRERVIFIGLKRDALRREAAEALSGRTIPEEYDPYPRVTHAPKPTGDLEAYVDLGYVFADLPEPEESDDLSHMRYSKAKYMGSHCQGQREILLDRIGPTIRSEHHGNIEFRRLSREHGGVHERELADGKPERRLSVRECARIQTFPDDYEFVFDRGGAKVSSSEAYQIVGNAVPPLLGYSIAMRLKENWARYFGA